MDDARRGPDGTIDYRGLLADELLEETGFGPERVLAAEPFALIYDGADDTWDLCMTIDLDLTEAEARAHLNRWRPGEYAELVLVAHADLRDFLRSHRSDLIPTARGMARVLDLAP
ncbi:MAG: hypothetical protein M5R36_29465 [Deltaproteobacteria bacterium]|nr:hypothetical protein [Deltaproteobacteria bacterium]